MTRSVSKPRQPRLRLSCDGCFHAKVKCSRGPLCARCLTNGLECRYSVSSRAGKPKASRASQASNYDVGGWGDGTQLEEAGMDLGYFGMTGTEVPGMLPWASDGDISSTEFSSIAMTSPYMSDEDGRPSSMDPAMAAQFAAWADAQDVAHMPTPSSLALSTPTSAYLPSPSMTTNSLFGKAHDISSSNTSPTSSCGCFADCLESLHALHSASAASPPFDVVLSLNKKAVQGCAAMLACAACMGRPGTHSTAMLLATMIGKITTFYKNASCAHFENSKSARPSTSVSVGAYTLGEADGRWLELELLARELHRLEELHARFRAVCADLTDDAEVCRVVVGYLEHNLGAALEVVNQQKGVRAVLDPGA